MADNQAPRGAIKSKMNMWSWDFERYFKLLSELDYIRLNVFDNDNSSWYAEMERYKSCLKTIVNNWICFITDEEYDEIDKAFNSYTINYKKGLIFLNNTNNISNHFINARQNLDLIDRTLMRIKQFKGLGLPPKDDINAKTKVRRYLLNNE